MGTKILIKKDASMSTASHQKQLKQLNVGWRAMNLWMYLMDNPNDAIVQITYKSLLEKGDMNKEFYLDAFHKLQDFGYIVKQPGEDSNSYIFYSNNELNKTINKPIEEQR